MITRPRFRLIVRPLSMLLCPFLFIACGEDSGDGDAAEAVDRKAQQVVEPPWTHTAAGDNITEGEIQENAKLEILEESPTAAESSKIHDQVLALLKQEDFTALDQLATQYLDNQERLISGSWKISAFYESFILSDGKPTAIWDRRREVLEKWIATDPKSQFARIALADYYKSFAWRARGSGWANQVSEEGWRLMDERLRKAGEVLNNAHAETTITDPSYYNVGLRVALGAGLPPSVFDGLVAGSLDLAPEFHQSLQSRAYSLLPRWFGEPGDWEAFAAFIAEENKEFGKEQYARIVLGLHDFSDSAVDVKRIDWELTKEGLRDLFRRYPKSLTNLSLAASLAVRARDREFANECFDLLGDRCLVPVWKVNGRMVHFRNWARHNVW